MKSYSTVGGILSIVSGVVGILGSLLLVGMIFFFHALVNNGMAYAEPFYLQRDWLAVVFFYGGMAVIFGLISILAIIGGIFAIKRRLWGLALAGAIAGIIVFFPCGAAATVLVAMARQEFLSAAQPSIVTST